MAWALLVALLIATLLVAIVLAYLITKRNFPVAESLALPYSRGGWIAASAIRTGSPSCTG